MFDKNQYELIDFGDGKKLEAFAGIRILRDCPAAAGYRPDKAQLFQTTADITSFEKRGTWKNQSAIPNNWAVRHSDAYFRLKPTPFGHVGVFPEQAGNWSWIQNMPIRLAGKTALNLFAYTGGTSMALASRGVSVTHVDTAKNIVRWASENAVSAGLQSATIRWIVEDALKFLNRELTRGKSYDIVVADPPAIGHSGKKMTWKFERDIDRLIELLALATLNRPTAILLSCHTANYNSHALRQFIDKHFDLQSGTIEAGPMELLSRRGRGLNCGHYCRWHRREDR